MLETAHYRAHLFAGKLLMFAVNKTHFSPGTGQQTRGSLGTGSGLKRAPGLAGGLLLVAPGAWREGEVRLSLSPASVQEPPRQTGAMAPDRRGTWQFWLLRCQKLAKQSHRIVEYPKSEGTHKDHQAQVLAPRRTTQKTDPVSESAVQMLLELWQLGVTTTAPGSL